MLALRNGSLRLRAIGQPPFFELNLLESQSLMMPLQRSWTFNPSRRQCTYLTAYELGLAFAVGDRKVISNCFSRVPLCSATTSCDDVGGPMQVHVECLMWQNPWAAKDLYEKMALCCVLYSKIMAINAKTPEKRAALQYQRQLHHDLRMQFFTAICLQQARAGRRAHVELRQAALSCPACTEVIAGRL